MEAVKKPKSKPKRKSRVRCPSPPLSLPPDEATDVAASLATFRLASTDSDTALEVASDAAEFVTIGADGREAAAASLSSQEADAERAAAPPASDSGAGEIWAPTEEAALAHRSSDGSTDASVTCGSPFTALGEPCAGPERQLYPDLAVAGLRPLRSSPLPGEAAGPSAPAAESPVESLSLSASQVSISEGPFCFETEKKPSLLCLCQDVAPLTDAQLADFYHNEELRQRADYEEHFVREYGPGHGGDEFHELVQGYRRAGAALRAAERERGELSKQYERRRSQCWDLVRRSVRGEAECDDGRTLSATHEFRSAVFDDAALEELRASLAALRRLLHNAYVLHAYSVLLARLQVEAYLHQLTEEYRPELAGPPPVAADARLQYASPRHERCAEALRRCCAELFAQQRLPAEPGFVAQTRGWLLRLGALLLRVATVNDHLFLLHQALRCPSGSADWTAPLLQPPRPDLPAGLDHVLTALAVILAPVGARAQFLAQSSRAESVEDEWVMLEDEEAEAEKTAGYLKLRENDLITMFNQLPWADVVRHLLRMGRAADGGDLYDPTCSSSHDMLRLFACGSQIIGVLAAGLAEYSDGAHKQLTKRLCHQLLHLVHYVSDHWESYSVTSSDDMATKGRLLVEYDSFVCRSAVSVLSSPRLAVWHFLASFPFGRLTPRTAWKLLWLFHTSGRPQEATALPSVPQDQDDAWAAEVFAPTFHAMFEHQLVHMSQSEVYFRLTALANMAMARGHRERTFIKAVTRDLVQVSFVTPTTRELCSRSGRDLLAAICNRHPFVMSYVLSLTQEHMETMGKSALYLFSGLPLLLWRPSDSDMSQVCAWLADHGLDSVESRLAQLVLARLDWGVRPYSGQLALPAAFHRRAALAAVAAQAARAPEPSRAAGLVGEGRRQVSALAALVADSAERRFQDWAWRQVALLRLHALDQPDGAAARALHEPAVALADLPRLDGPEMSPLEEAARRDQPLASYAALLMTSLGHSLPELYLRGLARLAGLVGCGRPAAVVHLLEVVMPLFVDDVDALCAEAFPTLLQTIVSADQSYLKMMKTLVVAGQPGPLIQQMAGMIEGHVTSHRCYGQESPVPLVTLWLRCLTCLPAWSRDPGLLHLLDQLLRAAFCRRDVRDAAELIVRELLKAGSGVRQSAGLSSLLAWVSGGTLEPLLPSASLPEVPWLAWFCLRAETRLEVESGLWYDLIATLCEERQMPLDQALKRVCSQQRLPQTPVQSLALYRWAQQALDTDLDCPLLPALWQHFFTLYLARVYDINGRNLGSVGGRFMEGLVNVQYQKRLKRRLQESADHYRRRAEQAEAREGEVIDGEITQLRRVAQLFGTFALWLEEPRLREPDIYLPDLPAAYNAPKLIDLLEQAPSGRVWEEFVNYYAAARLSEECLRRRQGSHHDHRAGSTVSTPVRSEDTPANRIVKRLRSYDARAPLPDAAPFQSPVPRLAAMLFASPEAALAGLEDAFSELVCYASWFAGMTAEHSALDGQYLELVPDLYANELSQVVQRIRCEQAGRAAPDHRCSGPATVVLECETARLNGAVYQRLVDNRQQAERLERSARADPPLKLGVAAVRLETFIKALVRRYCQDDTFPPHLQRIGAKLFHHVVAITTEETRQCPPVNQLLTACLEVLGQTFVQRHPAECLPLLETALRHGWLLAELTPHLTPTATDPDTYVQLYRRAAAVSREQASLVMALLTKFELESWLLSQRPSLSRRSALIAVLTEALSAFGPLPERPEWTALHELYRRHLIALHQHEFPEHYGEILQRLLDASREGRLSPLCWYDFVNVLAAGAAAFAPQMDAAQRRQAVAALAERPSPLGPQEMLDTCKLLASRFMQERLEAGLYGLYPRYKMYAAPLSALLGVVASSAVIGLIHRDRGSLSDKLVSELWQVLRDTFAPWLSPLSLSDRHVWQQCASWLQQLTADRQHLAAWIPGDGQHAQMLLDMFLHCVMMLNNTLPAGRPALSHLWEHYCHTYAQPSVQEHVRALVQAALLELPWDRLTPQLHDAERMVQLLDVYLPEAHSFAAQVVVQLPWQEVVEAYDRESPTASVRLHACLFSILIKVAFEPKIRQSGALFLLLSRAEAFSWHRLDAATYQRVLSWYIMSCDPVSVLETEAREPVDVALVGFLQVAAGHVASLERLHPETGQKRAAYVSAVVRLLANAASTHKGLVTAQRHGFTRTLMRLLRETELVISKMSPDEGFREAVPLVRELLQCMAARSPAPLQKLCARRLTEWVKEESGCVLLCPMLRTSGTIIYDMQHLSDFWETLISALFAKGSGVLWPDLRQLAEFPALSVARLLSASLETGNLLVLHLYLLQRLEADAEPLDLTATCVGWLTELTVLSDSSEPKLCLLLYQAVLLLERLADAGHLADVARHVRALAAALQAWGEDRDGSGLLGAIGFGRRSPLSPQFRLLCRIMASTLLCQLWTDGSVSLEPRPEEATERLSSDSSASGDSKWGLPRGLVPEAYQAFERLTALRSRREYAPYLQTLEEAVADVLSAATTLRSGRHVLADVVRRTYHDPCLHLIV